MGYRDWNDGMYGGSGWWILMTVVMVVFWGGLIWFAITLVRNPRHKSQLVEFDRSTPAETSKVARKTAQEILDKRLARGEIELDDYRQRLQALREPRE
jgi:putative membrane protein